jgi:glycosyltransferase involved in cell wall biosynthesis
LNDKTNFLGYINGEREMDKLFSDNTILISTSIIETLGLHVVEAIKKGIIPISPNEKYASSVYGNNIITYELFNVKSLLNAILSIINNKINCSELILTLQDDLKKSENTKVKSIVDIFQKVIDVQK